MWVMHNYALVVIDDFLEDPYSIRNAGISHLIDFHGDDITENEIINDGITTHPGFRTQNFVDIDPDLDEYIGSKVSEIIGNRVLIRPFFYLASAIHGCGLIHNDAAEIAGVIYLNENPPENSGTVLYEYAADRKYVSDLKVQEDVESGYRSAITTQDLDEIKSYNKFKKECNEKYFQPDCVVQNKFNRCIIYGGRRIHGAHNYFGKNIFDSRLVLTFQGDII
jgi:hypothetical protein